MSAASFDENLLRTLEDPNVQALMRARGQDPQNEVHEDTPWLDCADGFKNLPDDDADLIDSAFRIGQCDPPPTN